MKNSWEWYQHHGRVRHNLGLPPSIYNDWNTDQHTDRMRERSTHLYMWGRWNGMQGKVELEDQQWGCLIPCPAVAAESTLQWAWQHQWRRGSWLYPQAPEKEKGSSNSGSLPWLQQCLWSWLPCPGGGTRDSDNSGHSGAHIILVTPAKTVAAATLEGTSDPGGTSCYNESLWYLWQQL